MNDDTARKNSANAATANRPAARGRRKFVVVVLLVVVAVAFAIRNRIGMGDGKRPTIITADYWNGAPFTNNAWRTVDRRQRRTMVYDLLSRAVRIDMKQSEISAMLGPPESTGSEAGEIMWDYDIGDDVCGNRLLSFAFDRNSFALVYVGTRGDDPRSLAVDVRNGAKDRIRPQQTFDEAVRIFGWPADWELTDRGLLAEYHVGAAQDRTHQQLVIETREGVVTDVAYWDPNRF